MSKKANTAQPLRSRTLGEYWTSFWHRSPNTFIARWDTLKSDLPHHDVDQAWARLADQIRALPVDAAHGDVIDRLVGAENAQFVAEVTVLHGTRLKALDRVIAQGEWHYIHLQGQVHRLRGEVVMHLQQAQEAWEALTGEQLPTPADALAAAARPVEVPHDPAETDHPAPEAGEPVSPAATSTPPLVTTLPTAHVNDHAPTHNGLGRGR